VGRIDDINHHVHDKEVRSCIAVLIDNAGLDEVTVTVWSATSVTSLRSN